ncbi:MAG: hypothetical protein MJ014_07535 [Methanocorpusculum sp.]|nr:hypothetical protein [Methanocorpusculum sp.]
MNTPRICLRYNPHLRRYTKAQNRLPAVYILHSLKANPYPPHVRCIASRNVGADAASKNKVLLACASGISPRHIYYSGPGTPPVRSHRNFRSLRSHRRQLPGTRTDQPACERLGHRAGGRIRINPNFTMHGTPGVPSKFGIDEKLCTSDALTAFPAVRITGIHVHIQSRELDWKKIARYYENVFRLAVHIQQEIGHPLSFINFGSGIGVPYLEMDAPVNLDALGKRVCELIAAYLSRIFAPPIKSGKFLSAKQAPTPPKYSTSNDPAAKPISS